ncbi:signal peptidase I [Nocardioides sp. zg-1228]|uniref:signal peptidase I n=1 Tax=Nocardioides sp. zg-1228 TaxID=2763008 RepID=UPI001642850C|nr:signal peptidase I [Nocardioides sp. zg-1228]MBC2932177.1 signal peptidase I [Nocardioides sp. zg-1228]QSF57715.1 signal peptidase I [Nocardioides sp. zg-1228]
MAGRAVAVRVLRTAADVLVWGLAVIGVLSLGLWCATTLGVIKPLIVVSGSMEPEIMTGDLVVATPVPIEDVEVGDVLSLHNDVSDRLVTHRVIDVAQHDDGSWHVRMQGDANDSPDAGEYVVTDDTVLSPRWQFAGVGDAWLRLTQPSVAVPLVIAVAAILALSLMPRPGPVPAGRRQDAARDPHDDEATRDLVAASSHDAR